MRELSLRIEKATIDFKKSIKHTDKLKDTDDYCFKSLKWSKESNKILLSQISKKHNVSERVLLRILDYRSLK